MDQNSSITEIRGVGEKTQKHFEKMGVYTVGDILLRFPRDYVHYPLPVTLDDCESFGGQMYAVSARVERSPVTKSGRMQVTSLVIGKTGHRIELVWFRMPYIKNTLKVGGWFVFYGKVRIKNGKYVMEQPVVYTPEAYGELADRFRPVYALTSGISNNLMIKTVRQALLEEALLADPLPSEIRVKEALCEYNYAVKQIHFPDDMDTLITARKRLVFDEFFYFILGMQYQKEKRVKPENRFVMQESEFVDGLIGSLPFALTAAQRRVLSEMQANMTGAYAMQRLVQGDVGSGKTVLAFLMMAWAAHNGCQSAIMAPTEVLARQHFETFQKLSEQLGLTFPIVLLTGSMTARQKRSAYERLELYPNALIVGTHALIQEKVSYANLALVITDEQHRFGVRQRDVFAQKGDMPHILVMSATPIPRTLAIILYGDMDISVVDEVPAKRLPVKNCVVGTAYRPKAYAFIAEELQKGHQAYVICPLVEETEGLSLENVVDYSKTMMEAVPEAKVGVLHGKMKSEKKTEIMEAFAKNELQILVATTVVEVGVNVPNATVMLIENAERFGLAQLHQLRGRVGRGDAQSYCIMVNGSDSQNAKKRLEILNRSNDGFFIASEDLKLRGPGDFFGIRQSGELAFALADIYQDAAVLQAASEQVKALLERDPDLKEPEHQALRRRMECFAAEELSHMNL